MDNLKFTAGSKLKILLDYNLYNWPNLIAGPFL